VFSVSARGAPTLRNWTGDLRWRPAAVDRPADEDELVQLVRATAEPLRVLGAGHSFSPVAVSEDRTIQLDRLSGLEAVDRERQHATVWAGTRLQDLGPLLAQQGLALANQGDIDVQSLGGVLSTATHGTGVTLGCMATQVLELKLVTASGDTVTLRRERDGVRFLAAAVSLGSLGIISRVRLQLRPAYCLTDVRRTQPLEECLAGIETTAARHRHFEFLWFPYSDLALTKTLDIPPAGAEPPDRRRSFLLNLVMDNGGFWLSCQAARLFPRWTPALNRFCARTADQAAYCAPAHRIFPTPRLVRFFEMEYAVPAAQGPDCLREIRAFIERDRLPISFPIEYRHVAADDLLLSPFYQRPSVTLSVHVFAAGDHRAYFDGVEAIFRNHSGRPHWGKKHSAGPAYLRRVYPRWDEFQAIRQAFDPGGRFLNPHLRSMFLDAIPRAAAAPAARW
jgi:FAD-linked oxidoreductase